MHLDAEYLALFNPVGRGGVVVVNGRRGGYSTSFRRPADVLGCADTWPGNGDDADRIARRLGQLEMIHRRARCPVQIRPGTVLTAWLHVTNACNLRCPYCYVSKSARRWMMTLA